MDIKGKRLRLLFSDVLGVERGKYLYGDVADSGRSAFCIGVFPLTTDKAKSQLRIQDALQLAEKVGFPSWVQVDPKKMSGTFKGAPDRSEFGQDINESLVVELYSK